MPITTVRRSTPPGPRSSRRNKLFPFQTLSVLSFRAKEQACSFALYQRRCAYAIITAVPEPLRPCRQASAAGLLSARRLDHLLRPARHAGICGLRLQFGDGLSGHLSPAPGDGSRLEAEASSSAEGTVRRGAAAPAGTDRTACLLRLGKAEEGRRRHTGGPARRRG